MSKKKSVGKILKEKKAMMASVMGELDYGRTEPRAKAGLKGSKRITKQRLKALIKKIKNKNY